MNLERNESIDNTLDDIDRVFAISGVAVSGLAFLFYPSEEIENVSGSDLGFISTISKVISGLGLIGTIWSAGLLYERNVKLPFVIRWIILPLIMLNILAILLAIAIGAVGPGGIKKAGNFLLGKAKPFIFSAGAAGLIILMAVMPKRLLKLTYIGMVIHYLPAVIGATPMTKSPYYGIVVLVRAGGLATSIAGDVIDVATEASDDDLPELEA